uniref:Uncharacterized protein n=1 Tax=Neospora caninum (strain Liverpool) TaxID=572307 RepID=A0A0F7UME0_NEOCL|nr:TPA: hypothetical protein BN1204_053850 [Neospora caninum Liverpool]
MYTSWGGVGPLSQVDQEVYEVDRCKALAARARLTGLAKSSSVSLGASAGHARTGGSAVGTEDRWENQRALRGFSFAFVLEQLLASEVPLDWLEAVAWEEALAFFVDCYLKERQQQDEEEREKKTPENEDTGSLAGHPCGVAKGFLLRDGDREGWREKKDLGAAARHTGDSDGQGGKTRGAGATLLRPPPVLPLMRRFSRRLWFLQDQGKTSFSVSPTFPSFCSAPEAERETPSRAVSSVHSLPSWLFFFFEELASFLLFVIQQMQRLQQRGGMYVHLTSETWTRRYQHLHFCLEKVRPPRPVQNEIEDTVNQQLLSLSSSSSPSSSSSSSSSCLLSSAAARSSLPACSSTPLSLPPLHHLESSLCQFFPETSLTSPHSFWLLYDAKLCRWLVTRDSLPVREVYVHSNSVPHPENGGNARKRRLPSLTAINTAREEALFYLSLCGVGRSEEECSPSIAMSAPHSLSPLDRNLVDRLVRLLETGPDKGLPSLQLSAEGDRLQNRSARRRREEESEEPKREEMDTVSRPKRNEDAVGGSEEKRRPSLFSEVALRSASSCSTSQASKSDGGLQAGSPRRHPRSGQLSLVGDEEPEVILEEGDEEEERRAMLALSSSLRKTCRKRLSTDSTSSRASASRSVGSKRRRGRGTETEANVPPCSAEKENAPGAKNVEPLSDSLSEKIVSAEPKGWDARETAWLGGIFKWRDERTELDRHRGDRRTLAGPDEASGDQEQSCGEDRADGSEGNERSTEAEADAENEGKRCPPESPDKGERRKRSTAACVASSASTSFPSSRCTPTSSSATASSCGPSRRRSPGQTDAQKRVRGERETPEDVSLDFAGMEGVDVSRKENLSGGRFLVGSRFRNAFFSDPLLAFARRHAAFLVSKPTEAARAAQTAPPDVLFEDGEERAAPGPGEQETDKRIFTEKEILRVLRNYMSENCTKKGKKHFYCDNALKLLTGAQALPLESDKLLHVLKSAKLVTHFMIT